MSDVFGEDDKRRCEETKRTARILEIVQAIALAPRYYRRRDLAERFQVSERMIQKDLEIIRHGLTLSLTNDGDGYYFERLPHLPTTVYSFSEALALLAAARAAQVIPGVNSADLAAAIARLESVFPDEVRPSRAIVLPYWQQSCAMMGARGHGMWYTGFVPAAGIQEAAHAPIA